MFFWGGGVFWHEQLIKFFLASTCDFSSLPPYYSQLSSQPSHLNVVSASPVITLGALDFQFSFFVLFRGGVLFTTRVYYLPIRITPFSETRKRERESKKKERKKNELPRVCRIRTKTYTHTHVHTSYVRTYCWFQPPRPYSKEYSIVYLPPYLPTYLTSLAPVNFRKP